MPPKATASSSPKTLESGRDFFIIHVCSRQLEKLSPNSVAYGKRAAGAQKSQT
jgi:hypothetical protein